MGDEERIARLEEIADKLEQGQDAMDARLDEMTTEISRLRAAVESAQARRQAS